MSVRKWTEEYKIRTMFRRFKMSTNFSNTLCMIDEDKGDEYHHCHHIVIIIIVLKTHKHAPLK